MPRTIRRQPLSISTNAPQQYFFNQAQFTGMHTDKNEATIDAQSFEDVKNLYVDGGTLLSRAPFKFSNDNINAILQWRFGEYHLVLYRYLYLEEGTGGRVLGRLSTTDYTTYKSNLYVVYTLRCTSHDIEDIDTHRSQYHIQMKAELFGKKYEDFKTNYTDLIPQVTCEQIESKVFIWFAGSDILVFNTAGEPYFESAANYIYLPIHETVVNRVKNIVEDKNILTDTYLRRYVYSKDSDLNFSQLRNETVRVSVLNGTREQYLYDYKIDPFDDPLLIHPRSYVDENVELQEVQTARGSVMLKRNGNDWSVSFDGRAFRNIDIPSSFNVQLTHDGYHLVAMGEKYIYYCPLVATETEELSFVDTFVWKTMEYFCADGFKYSVVKYSGGLDSASNKPDAFVFGYFESIDKYVYLARLEQRVLDRPAGSSDDKIGYYCVCRHDDNTTLLNTEAITDEIINELPYYYMSSRVNKNFVNFYGKDTQAIFVYSASSTNNSYLSKAICYTSTKSASITFAETKRRIPHSLSALDARYFADSNTTMYQYEKGYCFDILATVPSINDTTTKDVYVYLKHYSIFYLTETDEWKNFANNAIDYGFKVTSKTNGTDFETEKPLQVIRGGDDTYLCNYGIVKLNGYTYEQYRPGRLTRIPVPSELDGDAFLPLSMNIYGVNYYVKKTSELWTSVLGDTILHIDTYVHGPTLILNEIVPDKHIVSNEHYFSFYDIDTGKYLLNVTESKFNADDLEKGEFTRLLYLPKKNEQVFSEKITALHQLSDTIVGIFTQFAIWYISLVTLNDGTIAYTRPVKSKIPAGCRDGDQVFTALDGQTIIFATPRGIAALAPQDFIATTEKTITYLTENIYSKYYDFYTDTSDYLPMIRIASYKRFLLFYKYMQREILILDGQTGAWWSWETQYPVMLFYDDTQLHVSMYIDYINSDILPLQGVDFVYGDMLKDIEYVDDIVALTTNGELHTRTDKKLPVRSVIDWYFASQKLDFGQPNNYKGIKGVNLNIKDAPQFCAKLTSKTWRDISMSESDATLEFDIKDLRTFVQRFNLWQVKYFQYILSSTENDTPYQLKLNSLNVKYEIKGRVR